MKKAINLYYLNGDTKEKLDNIKKAGFQGVFSSVYDKNETMTLEKQIEYCKEIGLGISMIHCSYIEPKLNDFWTDSTNGDEVERDIIAQINRIKGMGVKNFVIHTNGGVNVINSEIGLNRIRKILKICENYDINLCIENLYTELQVNYIFDNIKHKNLKFCYDSGHENFLTPNADFFSKYAELLTTVHLHDNFGSKDEHKPLAQGNLNLNKLAKNLVKCDFEYLSAEVKYYTVEKTQLELLKENLEALNKLENLIIKNNKG